MNDCVIESSVLVKYTGNDHEVVIPQGVTEIGERAFCDCKTLEKVTIGGHVKTLKEHAFHGCTNLKELVLEEGVKTIKYQAFRDCKSLVNLELPNSVTSIGKNAFQGCSGLQYVRLSDGLKNLLESVFQDCKKLAEVHFGQSLKRIDYYAFGDCAALTKITLSDNLETIDESAFSGCRQLQQIVFGKQLKIIGAYAFSRCNNLFAVELPQSIKEVKKNSFPKTCKVTCPGNEAIAQIFPEPVSVGTTTKAPVDTSRLVPYLLEVDGKVNPATGRKYTKEEKIVGYCEHLRQELGIKCVHRDDVYKHFALDKWRTLYITEDRRYKFYGDRELLSILRLGNDTMITAESAKVLGKTFAQIAQEEHCIGIYFPTPYPDNFTGHPKDSVIWKHMNGQAVKFPRIYSVIARAIPISRKSDYFRLYQVTEDGLIEIYFEANNFAREVFVFADKPQEGYMELPLRFRVHSKPQKVRFAKRNEYSGDLEFYVDDQQYWFSISDGFIDDMQISGVSDYRIGSDDEGGYVDVILGISITQPYGD